MTIVEFRNANPDEFDAPLRSMWWDSRDNWQKAHEIAQDAGTSEAAWVHAYLHRKEGDQSNAGYWYRRAGRPVATGDIDAEWQHIVEELLARQ
jgi:hypothetical protein